MVSTAAITDAARLRELRVELSALFRVIRRVAPRRSVAQAIAVLLLGLTDGLGLVLLVPVVSAIDGSGAIGGDHVPMLSTTGLDNLSIEVSLIVLVSAVALRSIIGRWSEVTGTGLRLSVVDQLRGECLDAVLRARWEFVLGRRRSDIVEVITVGANRVGVAVDQSIAFVIGLVLAVTTAVVALLISPLIGALAIFASFVAATVLLPAVRSARLLGKEFGQRSKAAMATTTDALDALRLVRAHDAIAPWEGALARGYSDLRAAQLRHARAAATANAFSTVLLMVGSAGFVLVAARAGIAAGTLVVLLVVLSRLAGRFMQIARLLPTLGSALGALGDVEGLRIAAEAHAESSGIGKTTDACGHPASDDAIDLDAPVLEFRGVGYRYPDGTVAVEDLDLVVPRGEVTVLVGPTGAGKSTVVDLMLGLLRPEAGVVLIDGLELTPERLAGWRARVGYVPQETGLLPGTLRDNLLWSAGAGLDDAQCWAALRDGAASFAASLPDGLDTVLGDRGVRLSGGERQRVALARALIRRPELLLLDEATSSLDLATEAEVLGVIRGLCPATTVVLVTHRLGSIVDSDHVVRIAPTSGSS